MDCYATPMGGSIWIFFVEFYFAQLKVTVLLALPMQEGGNKGNNFKEGRKKCKQRIFKWFPQIGVAYWVLEFTFLLWVNLQ